MARMAEPREDTRAKFDDVLAKRPDFADRLARRLIVWLHREGHAAIEDLYRDARSRIGRDLPQEDDPNRPADVPAEPEDRIALQAVVFERAATVMSPEQVQDVVDALRRREEAESLESLAALPDIPFGVLSAAVRRFAGLPRGDETLAPAQTTGIRVTLTRHFISDQLEFIGVAKRFLGTADFDWILDRIVGFDRGQGRIGGKAAGMYLGWKILQGASKEHAGSPVADVHLPESWFLRSDVIEAFIRHNRLDEYQSQKYKDPEEIRTEFPLIRELFRNGEFPHEIVGKLDHLLERIGQRPVIVRSSSLLEDRFGAAFSGMYASIFLGNQGPRRERLRSLLNAIAEVYASTLAPNPLLYRRRHDLVDYQEDMAILIQTVVGRPHGRYYFPDCGGVGFSRNEYRWSPRLKGEDGVARMVYGLGTRAVDRTGNDHSRMVALGAPRLRPEVTPAHVARYSQKQVDVVDLAADAFRTVGLADLLAEGDGAHGLEEAASVRTRDAIVEPTGVLHGVPADKLVLTFDKLLGRTRFAALMKERLQRLEEAYDCPVNIEFASVDGKFYLLQCRPLVQAEAGVSRGIPRGISREKQLFSTRGLVRSGDVRAIDYVVFVDPRAYDGLPSAEARNEVARVVARVNDALEGKTFVLMGPGRWGSVDSRLGVKVSYADINHCAVLVEVAYRTGDYVPEVSYGTHFFQDLVEDGIYYLALYPDEETTVFSEGFFRFSDKALSRISPRDAAYERVVRVIPVADAAPGRLLHLAMDGEAGEALCWLE